MYIQECPKGRNTANGAELGPELVVVEDVPRTHEVLAYCSILFYFYQ
jgi:hypothetical protein